MNLYHHYPHIYWQCAVLTVNASANEDDSDGTTNYGKIAKAIGDMMHNGVRISLPDVNRARFGFSTDTQNNSIVFGLKAINGVGDDDASQIIANRPYESLNDFYLKNSNLGNSTLIALIKAGALDALGAPMNRVEIMRNFILRQATASCPPKDKLTMANFKVMDSLDIIPSRYEFERNLTNFKTYAFNKRFQIDENTYWADDMSKMFFESVLYKFFTEGEHCIYEGDTLLFYKKPIEKFYNNAIKDFKAWLMLPSTVSAFNQKSRESAATDLWNKYCTGTLPHWEMESLSFYYTAHELTGINMDAYGLSNFSTIPPDPILVGSETRKGKTWDKYQIFRIAGTVLDKNKNKHTVTLLTTDGVVTIKFYGEAFAFYDKQISHVKEDGKKEVLEKSWLSRGNMLIITGIRRGDNFYPKKYADTIYQHTVCLIRGVQNGYLDIQNERIKS